MIADRRPGVDIYNMTLDGEEVPVNCSGSYIPSLILQSQSETTTFSTLLDLYNLLDVNAEDNIWKRLDDVIERSNSTLNFISLFDWDIFMAVKDEGTIEQLSKNYDERQELNISFVYAGIIFDNLHGVDEKNDTPVPPKVRMRLRLNSTFVHDTTLMRQK